MTYRIEFDEVTVLIPGYAPDDIPTDLDDAAAESLLNACVTAWHPEVLARSRGIPAFRQAEALNHFSGRHVFLVPAPAVDWMPHDWQNDADASTSVAVGECTTREEWVTRLQQSLAAAAPAEFAEPGEPTEPSSGSGETAAPADRAETSTPCCVDDFFALGLCHLLIVVLSRRMHHFVDPDESTLDREVHLAAAAAVAGDETTTRTHLQACFDSLRETREQFYPLDCWFIDLCVPPTDADPGALRATIEATPQLNLVVSASELHRWCDADTATRDTLTRGLDDDRLSLLSGTWNEPRSQTSPCVATLHDLKRGRSAFRALTGHDAACWGRRRFGLSAGLPLLLHHTGFRFAMHTALDEGLYPEAEHSWFEWHTASGTHVTASSRIPLAIDSPAAVLKLPDRLRESMQDDASAIVFFARLPDIRTPWPHDLRRAASWSPVLGTFTTLDQLCADTSLRGRRMAFKHDEYLSPQLIQSSVVGNESPISDPARLYRLWLYCESVAFQTATRAVIRPAPQLAEWTRTLEDVRDRLSDLEAERLPQDEDGRAEEFDAPCAAVVEDIRRLANHVASDLLECVPSEPAAVSGLFVQNPLPTSRVVTLDWSHKWKPPQACDELLGFVAGRDGAVVVRLPPGGFLWLTEATAPARQAQPFRTSRREPPLAEELTLRNRVFEVTLSETSGGIESVRFHGTRENLLSQRPCFRYERSQPLPAVDGTDRGTTFYARTVLTGSRVLRSDTLRGEIETSFELRAPTDDSLVCRGRQVVRVNRFESRMTITLSFDDIPTPPRGNPWLTYFGSRFAWSRPDTAVSTGALHQAATHPRERFETPDYIELAHDEHRVTLAVHGRPAHRRSGDEMIDSLLVVEGEPGRTFSFTVDVDQPHPMAAVLESIIPPVVIPTRDHRPARAGAAWILGVAARNAMIVQSSAFPVPSDAEQQSASDGPDTPCRGIRLTLLETEGRNGPCEVRTARQPQAAWRISGTDREPLTTSPSGVTVPLPAFGICEVELHF